MEVSKLFKYLIPMDIKSLSKKERCYSILLYIVPFLLFCLVLSISANDFSFMILWGLYCILLFPWFFYLLSYERLERKYKILSDIRFGNTYEFFSKLMVFSVPGVIITLLVLSNLLGYFSLGITISLAFIIPSFALLFRNDVFNDNSCIDGDEIILGYIPTWYALLSLVIGIYGYVHALKMTNISVSIILIVVTIIFQIFFVVPDQFNRFTPFDVKYKKGGLMLIISLLLIYIVLLFFISWQFLSNIENINLSFESIIRKVIIWGVGIGLAILFARKIKMMGK